MIKYIPAGHRILIKVDRLDTGFKTNDEKIVTKSGFEFYKPEKKIELDRELQMDQSTENKGTIISIGARAWYGCHDGMPWAKEGDRILFKRYAGDSITTEDKEEGLRLIEDVDILAIIIEE